MRSNLHGSNLPGTSTRMRDRRMVSRTQYLEMSERLKITNISSPSPDVYDDVLYKRHHRHPERAKMGASSDYLLSSMWRSELDWIGEGVRG